MSRNRTDDRYRLIGALVQLQIRKPRRWREDDQDYVIRLATALSEDGYWLEWAPREPLYFNLQGSLGGVIPSPTPSEASKGA